METIFASVASYRDPECRFTVLDLLDKALHPDRVFFGVCSQYLPEEEEENLAGLLDRGNVRLCRHAALDSKGPGWARSRSHGLRRGEDYFLQIDSHMRAHRGWDVALINLLALCPSDNPIISTYPAVYDPPDALQCSTPHLSTNGFDPKTRMPALIGYNWTAVAPVPRAFASAGYLFAPARLIDEVPYDPHVYFKSAEPSYSARAWTHGWDMFSPHFCIMHHQYLRTGARRHWSDHLDWARLYENSLRRGRHLLGVEASADPDVVRDLDETYGLGGRRTLTQYEEFSGLDFRNQTLHPGARSGLLPGQVL